MHVDSFVFGFYVKHFESFDHFNLNINLSLNLTKWFLCLTLTDAVKWHKKHKIRKHDALNHHVTLRYVEIFHSSWNIFLFCVDAYRSANTHFSIVCFTFCWKIQKYCKNTIYAKIGQNTVRLFPCCLKNERLLN